MNVLFFQLTVGFYIGGTIAYLVYLLSSYERAAWAGRFLLGAGF
jgi:hypothetical protein